MADEEIKGVIDDSGYVNPLSPFGVSNADFLNRFGGEGSTNPLSLFGIKNADYVNIVTRAGIILLGAALCIVGIAFVLSGTKAASVAVSAIPVAGKVLS